ncbi:hypothetical protein MLD38_040057 [Melastoma candidum]|uniref:Uncharacterized protein n=1 Tax=Melastoma candidum TaxID=119954 RepID=A0ACB9L4Z7_9MYRT|nr:hypothetical protein MLD38_040057 [Melastoma candidum]
MAGVKRRAYTDSDIHALHKELDEVSCPICMDHPHNAVLLLCSSHEKGCRSYICDTSYRHSNCLDRFKKLRVNASTSTLSGDLPGIPDQFSGVPDTTISLVPQDNNVRQNDNSRPSEDHNALVGAGRDEGSRLPPEVQGGDHRESSRLDNQVEGIDLVEVVSTESLHGRAEVEETVSEDTSESKLSLKCPLCRGAILGWEVREDARRYLNLKRRSCCRESCSYNGDYQELRRHARRVHPTVRPTDVDPSREHAWRRLEHQREYGDIVSAIRSAIPGSVVVGDYIIENGDRFSGGRVNGTGEGGRGPWWTTFFLFHMIGAMEANGDPRPRSRALSRHRHLPGSERRALWGENLLGFLDDDDPDDEDDDSDEGVHILSYGEETSSNPRRRRRLTGSRSDEDRI